MRRPTRRVVVGALACLVVSCTAPAADRAAEEPPPAGRETSEPATPAPTSSPATPRPGPPSPTPTPMEGDRAMALLTDPGLAAAASPADLHGAVRVASADGGPLGDLVAPPWQDRVDEDLDGWPVTVGTATLALDGAVTLDVVVASPPEDDGELVLRWLASASALGDAVRDLAVEVDGRSVDLEADAAGARLVVPVPDDRGAVVRVRADYRVPARTAVADDGTPAGYGLLARTDDALMLGHWLPLVALESDDGPMLGRGDVGGFPAGAFSLVVEHEGTIVSGGEERPCPTPATGCTWLQGLGVRDLSAVLLADAERAAATGADGTTAVVSVPSGAVDGSSVEAVATEAVDGLAALGSVLGPLPWRTVDVVAAPIAPGAAGMEFPGMVWVDPGAWPDPDARFGSYVLAHELGHQWFHAVVGNGSLSHPVVDESLAQYSAVVVFDELFGPGEGTALAERSLGGRWRAAVADGVPDDAPAQPLADFTTDRSYGSAVYGRAGQAWVDAEDVAGRDVVLAALRSLVSTAGLREVTEEDVLAVLDGAAPAAAPAVRAGWGLD